MTPWRTYADPPSADPEMTRAQRRARGRARRDEVGFSDALSTAGTGFVVWMCADGLGAAVDGADDRGRAVVDAVRVDDALPGPWEWDLLDLARGLDPRGGRTIEALAEGYQQAVDALAEEPLHAVRSRAVVRARRLAEGIDTGAAESASTAVRRLISPAARLRHDRVARRWGAPAGDAGDISGEMAQYRESLPESTALLLANYHVQDAVGSDDGRLMVLLARGADADDVLLLEGCPAGMSPREDTVGAWRGGSDVQRILLARETVPLVPVQLAGWSTSADGAVARVWSRARASTAEPDLGGARARARRLGGALGLLHGASADAATLAGYLGRSRRFAQALREAVRSPGPSSGRSG